MKTLSKILKILTLVLTLAGLALFFTNFVTLHLTDGASVNLVGAQLAWGGKVNELGGSIAKSPKIIFCMILMVIAAIAAALNFRKSQASRWTQIAMTAVAGIYMLVVALSKPWKFFDFRPFTSEQFASEATYTVFVPVTALVILASLVCGIAHLLVEDHVNATAAKKMTIPQRLGRFFREYKSEIKKIVWPGPRSVVKNTLIVLLLCAILGVFIWLIDWGLSSLIKVVTTKSESAPTETVSTEAPTDTSSVESQIEEPTESSDLPSEEPVSSDETESVDNGDNVIVDEN